jgi:hypothetical protein
VIDYTVAPDCAAATAVHRGFPSWDRRFAAIEAMIKLCQQVVTKGKPLAKPDGALNFIWKLKLDRGELIPSLLKAASKASAKDILCAGTYVKYEGEAGIDEGVTPFQYCLFTPELQWQSRGKWRILQGCKQGLSRDLWSHFRLQLLRARTGKKSVESVHVEPPVCDLSSDDVLQIGQRIKYVFDVGDSGSISWYAGTIRPSGDNAGGPSASPTGLYTVKFDDGEIRELPLEEADEGAVWERFGALGRPQHRTSAGAAAAAPAAATVTAGTPLFEPLFGGNELHCAFVPHPDATEEDMFALGKVICRSALAPP